MPDPSESIHLDSIRTVLRAVDIRLPASYRWLGTRRSAGRRSDGMTRDDVQSQLAADLQWNLYRNFYTTGGTIVPLADASDPPRGSSSLVTALSEANEGAGHWQDGWVAAATAAESAVLVRAGLRALVELADCRPDTGPADPHGAALQVRVPKELRNATPGFYLAVGDAGSGAGSSSPVLRWYWNATALGAVELMRLVTSRLNAATIPFQIKALNDPVDYRRCDAVVLYTRVDQYTAIAPIMANIYEAVSARLAERTPPFAKPLAPGLAIAEDPGNGESFGAHRCRLLAEGLVAAEQQARRTEAERLEAVAEHVGDSGVDLTRPFLSESETDGYVAFDVPSHRSSPPTPAATTFPLDNGESSLLHANVIARRLIDSAVWHSDQCTWFGVRRGIANPIGGRRATAWGVLGPTLYAGTSGIALFLAELAAATGMPLAAETALGAIRNGLARAESINPSMRLGLYSGCTGIAYAATRAGVLLGDDRLVGEGEALIVRCADSAIPESEFDVIAGSAGGVLACLAVHALTGKQVLLDIASTLGESLLAAAVVSARGIAWRPPGGGRQRPLTGLAHGTSGAALALTELYGITRDARYRSGANAAFDYERAWFDPVAGNWPDFRWGAGSAKHRIFATSWCHGAPGMALSRARAWSVTADPEYKSEAEVALATTTTAIAAAFGQDASTWALCHGVIGNIEIVKLAADALGAQGARYREAAEADSARLCRDRSPEWWSSGGSEPLPDPSLMVGMAGAGMFFLRHARENVAPVLLLSTTGAR
ncbi:MAG TPA: lanthionine synthetase LanC family protein [Homoserinimonas sp.]|nr:lanthionine synthetase LanC family protein [Homoserinimonas sp.]